MINFELSENDRKVVEGLRAEALVARTYAPLLRRERARVSPG